MSDGVAAGSFDRAKALSAFKLGDVTFYWMTRLAAISGLLILDGIIISLFIGAWPAMRVRLCVFVEPALGPQADPPVLGALGPIYGTLITSFIAMLIAIPVGLVGVAIFLTELCRNGCVGRSGLPSNCSPAFPRSSTACGASSC